MSTKQPLLRSVALAAITLTGLASFATADLRADVPARVAYGESAEFVLVNNTSVWLSLYIDGVRSASVPPGDRGVDFITPGEHSFVVYTLDSTGRSASHSGYVGPEGKTWTISEN